MKGGLTPTSRQRPNRTRISSDKQRARARKPSIIPRTLRPPVGRRVDNRIPARRPMIRIAEIADPADHRRGAEPVARRAAGVVFDVEQARERAAVRGPAAAVREEVVCLRGARAAGRLREMVPAAD